MRVLLAALFVLTASGSATMALAQPTCQGNECTTIILHAIDTGFGQCADAGTVDCAGVMPATDVTGMATPAVYMLLRNYDECFGVQAAFDVPGDWSFNFGLWNCQPNQLNATEPAPPWGPTNGSITSAFDGITGGTLATVGRLHFSSAGTGCITLVDSSFPFGTHVIDGQQADTQVEMRNRGVLCNGIGGYDACDWIPQAVEPATWGKVKAQYR